MQYKIDNINNLSYENYIQMLNILPPYYKNKINKLKHENKKKQTVLGQFLLLTLLKEFYNIEYSQIEFTVNKNGKPFIKNKNIYFNISHCEDLVICVISSNKIGVDIERIKNIDNIYMTEFFCLDEEKKYISNNKNKFFTIWTMKEAYIKMLGKNIWNIKNYQIKIINNNIILKTDNVKFTFINDVKNYKISVCEYIKNFHK